MFDTFHIPAPITVENRKNVYDFYYEVRALSVSRLRRTGNEQRTSFSQLYQALDSLCIVVEKLCWVSLDGYNSTADLQPKMTTTLSPPSQEGNKDEVKNSQEKIFYGVILYGEHKNIICSKQIRKVWEYR
jgi:hypothetical protein